MELSKTRILAYACFLGFTGVLAFLAPIHSPKLRARLFASADRNLEWNRGVFFQLLHAVTLVALFATNVAEEQALARHMIVGIGEMMAIGTIFVAPCLYIGAVKEEENNSEEEGSMKDKKKLDKHLAALFAFALSYGSVFVLSAWFLLGIYALTLAPI